MPLENRELAVGTRLVGRYKKEDHFCEVVQGEDGEIRYRLEDGREFKSLSSAGSAVMGGVACNGWRFWSLADGGEEAEARQAKPKRATKAEKKAQAKRRPVHRMDNQEGASKGYVRYFCAACLDSFDVEGEQEPEACPAGHRAEPEPAEAAIE